MMALLSSIIWPSPSIILVPRFALIRGSSSCADTFVHRVRVKLCAPYNPTRDRGSSYRPDVSAGNFPGRPRENFASPSRSLCGKTLIGSVRNDDAASGHDKRNWQLKMMEDLWRTNR